MIPDTVAMLGKSYAKIILPLALAFAAACGPITQEGLQTEVAQQGWNNFQTAVASDRNYDVYWLGREVRAGNQTFSGPEALAEDDPGGTVEGGDWPCRTWVTRAAPSG